MLYGPHVRTQQVFTQETQMIASNSMVPEMIKKFKTGWLPDRKSSSIFREFFLQIYSSLKKNNGWKYIKMVIWGWTESREVAVDTQFLLVYIFICM